MVRGDWEAHVRALFVPVCFGVLAACDSMQSSGHDTSQMQATLEADAPGDGQVTVRVTLRPSERSRTSLDLVAPDSLTATVGQTTRTLERHSMLGAIWYDASFPVDAAGTHVKVALSRPTSTDAPDSEVTLPAPFEFESPAENASFTRSESITVKWSVTGDPDPLLLSARGACIKPVDIKLESNAGAHTFLPFEAAVGHKKDSCVVDVHAIRSRDGSVDAAFEKGTTFKSTASRTVRITSTP